MISPEIMTAMMGDLIEVAKEKRAEDGYKKGDEQFVPAALLFIPDRDPTVILLTWDTNEQKRNLMRGVSLTARQVGAEAIALITDTRWTNSERISEYYNLPTVEEVGIKEFARLYNKLRNERYNGEIKNMPREVWEEAVTVMMKGPGLTPQVRMAHYKEAANDGIEWLEEKTTNADNRGEFMLLPDWWTH